MSALGLRERFPMLSFESRAALTLLILSCALPTAAQQRNADWVSITPERLGNPEPGDWLGYRRTYGVTGFSPLREINRRNVDELRPIA